jgi:mono/diheme cytochrome c family protein
MRLFLLITVVTLVIPAAPKGDPAAGKTAFTATCKTCHGPQGDGNPAIAKALKVNIPPLSAKEVQAKSDEEIKKAIVEGTGKMKPVAGLSGKQVGDVIAFVRTLNRP